MGRGIELLFPDRREWHKALVQGYAAFSGRHLLLFSAGDTQWLALARGFYAWNVSAGKGVAHARAPPAQSSALRAKRSALAAILGPRPGHAFPSLARERTSLC